MAEQTEKAVLKETRVFLSSKKSMKGKRPGKDKTRHSNIPALISPCRFRVKEGDHLIIGQCRPLSKTVRFNVLKVIPAGSFAGGKKAFTGM
ncbi:hypothetical protein Peur_006895 [Populus x canadensis]